ncbi:MerR family transcriptional regulator [Campylobacter hyointestinalis]|uniref:MerR family transcriptional regulator n=1 Tax=Campylobacter hyointestinalis TaxID=198 RepID=UPI00116158F3|nr:MerR family transcriptional regulator [Campylobacter hyointestinalis]
MGGGARYFSKSDIEWVEWVVRFRKMGMSVERLREYINLAIKGDSTLKERLEMIKEEKSRILTELDEIKAALLCVDKKIEFYETAIKAKADPHAKGGKKCE